MHDGEERKYKRIEQDELSQNLHIWSLRLPGGLMTCGVHLAVHLQNDLVLGLLAFFCEFYRAALIPYV